MPRGRTNGIGAACALALALACACRFDSSGGAGGDGGNRDAGGDGGTPDAMGECPEPIRLRLSVDGASEPLGPGEPYAHVRIGDTVRLSAAGSCVQQGPISYRWQISPIDGTRDSALPGLESRDVEVYSIVKDRQYTVRLTITDGDGASNTDLVYAFLVHGFELIDGLPGGQDVTDLSFGGGALWVASNGAFRYDPGAGAIEDLSAAWTFAGADTFSDKIEWVWYDPDTDRVWLGHKDSRPGLWRGDPSGETLSFVRYDGATALNDSTSVNDIGPAFPGVRIATDLGVTTAPDGATFNGKIAPPAATVEAIGGTAAAYWMGGVQLWDFATPWVELDPFGAGAGNDNKIRGMGPDDELLWLASDGFGVARVILATGEPVDVYDNSNTGDLPDDAVRALAVDADGDVWAATKSGIARYKRDRNMWLTLDGDQGLADRDDLKAVALDPDSRAIYAGSNRGLVYIRLP